MTELVDTNANDVLRGAAELDSTDDKLNLRGIIKNSTSEPVPVSWPEVKEDSFGRLRVSEPVPVWEWKNIYNIDFDLYWDNELTSGGTLTHNSTKGCRELDVTTSMGSKTTVRTRRRFEYNTGISHKFQFTLNPNNSQTGVAKSAGMFDDNNGFFWRFKDGDLAVVYRSSTSGSVVDNVIEQADFNQDKLDGTDVADALDLNNDTLYFIDFAWLGAAVIRFGIVQNGVPVIAHAEIFSQGISESYTLSAVLPFAIEIESTGTPSASDSIQFFCASYQVEGKLNALGKVRTWNQGITETTVSAEEVVWAGRLNDSYPYSAAIFERINIMIESGNDEVLYKLYHNPTFTGTPTWVDQDNSIMQIASNANTLGAPSAGFEADSGYIRTGDVSALKNSVSDVFFGFSIDETADIFMITIDSLNGSANITVNTAIREFY